jgi:hypothetical protein
MPSNAKAAAGATSFALPRIISVGPSISGKQAVAIQDGVDQINFPSTGCGGVQPREPWMKIREFTGEIFAETAMLSVVL